MTSVALDTSVAVPLLVRTHEYHATVRRWLGRRDAILAGHAVAETYSVLTRLPHGLRLTPPDAAMIIQTRFGTPLTLDPLTAADLPRLLADAQITGGAVYDALVALAALEHHAPLATRDGRAKATYDALGVRVLVVA
ncbi:MAG: PIN domain-containing protein [Solirubrobacteraceae bacterium]